LLGTNTWLEVQFVEAAEQLAVPCAGMPASSVWYRCAAQCGVSSLFRKRPKCRGAAFGARRTIIRKLTS